MAEYTEETHEQESIMTECAEETHEAKMAEYAKETRAEETRAYEAKYVEETRAHEAKMAELLKIKKFKRKLIRSFINAIEIMRSIRYYRDNDNILRDKFRTLMY